jgi:glycosyltransferase involved in cell wall biosynthesis
MDSYPETAERAGLIQPGSLPSRSLRWLNRQLYRHLDAVVGLDRAMQDLLVSAYADRGRPAVHVLPNWEPEARFPLAWSPPEWKDAARLGLRGRLVVLYLGNAGSGHDFETALGAATRLADEPATFLFVGGGSAWPGIQSESDRRSLQNVIMRGYVAKEEVPSVLAAADVALITLRDSMLGVMSPSKLGAAG